MEIILNGDGSVWTVRAMALAYEAVPPLR